jgi:transposase InsO family protein
MSVKAVAAVVAVGEGVSLNVAQICRDEGVSRKTFYKWVNRYRAEGTAGLEERSRRPRSSPQSLSAELENEIVRLRKWLEDESLDAGARTIQWHLGRERRDNPTFSVPAVATIHRVLVRRGMVVPQPSKRPNASWQRFEAAAPNEMWQIDGMDWAVATGPVKIINLIDDHSRLLTRSHAAVGETTRDAWRAFSLAAAMWGMPARMLSDNGLGFSGKLRRLEVEFEYRLREAGVRPSTGRAYHPQTTGKVERFQQTLKKWLSRQRLAADLVELQAQLDRFQTIYNEQRPHQGIGRATPMSRWRATPALGPASEPLAHPQWASTTTTATVDGTGMLRTHRHIFGVGVEWAGKQAVLIIDRSRANVFIDDELIRHYKLNNRRYQPSNRPRGGPRRPRLQ